MNETSPSPVDIEALRRDVDALTSAIAKTHVAMLQAADACGRCFALAEDLRMVFGAWQRLREWMSKHAAKG